MYLIKFSVRPILSWLVLNFVENVCHTLVDAMMSLAHHWPICIEWWYLFTSFFNLSLKPGQHPRIFCLFSPEKIFPWNYLKVKNLSHWIRLTLNYTKTLLLHILILKVKATLMNMSWSQWMLHWTDLYKLFNGGQLIFWLTTGLRDDKV